MLNLGKAAVECKFRSKYFNRDRKKLISWPNASQVDRYKSFGKSRMIPVYMAVGFGDDPTKPSLKLLAPIEQFIDISRKINVTNFVDAQYMIDKDKARNFAISTYAQVHLGKEIFSNPC